MRTHALHIVLALAFIEGFYRVFLRAIVRQQIGWER